MDRQDRALKVLEELTIELHRKNDLLDYTTDRPCVKAPAPPRVLKPPVPERISAKKDRSEFAYRFTGEFKPGLTLSKDQIEIRVELLGSCLYAQREWANFKLPQIADTDRNFLNIIAQVDERKDVFTGYIIVPQGNSFVEYGREAVQVSGEWMLKNAKKTDDDYFAYLEQDTFEAVLNEEIKNSTSKNSPNEISTLSKDEVLIVNFKHINGSRLALLKYDKPFVYANGGEGWFMLDDTDALEKAFLHQDGFEILSKNKPIPFLKDKSVTITDIVTDTSGVQLKAKTYEGKEFKFLLKDYPNGLE